MINNKKITAISLLFLSLFSLSSCSNESGIKNVILFIGDGMGPNHVDAGGVYLGEPLCFDFTNDIWSYHAYANTDSNSSKGHLLNQTLTLLRPEVNSTLVDSYATDSAAAATAMATGQKVKNSRLSIDDNGNQLKTLVEIAKENGKKAGVVTSDTLTGATPSAFYAHTTSRDNVEEIFTDLASSPVDLVMGRTSSDYTENQATYAPLFMNAGFDLVYDKIQFNDVGDKVLGMFPTIGSESSAFVHSLEELTTFSLNHLENDKGFFLMVEGAYIDKHSHNNKTEKTLEELKGFNDAVKAAQEWAKNRDDTIILVTADHETGGLYYDRENSTQDNIINNINWLTTNHTRTRVDVAISGDISEFLKANENNINQLEGLPYWDNTDIFSCCSMYLK